MTNGIHFPLFVAYTAFHPTYKVTSDAYLCGKMGTSSGSTLPATPLLRSVTISTGLKERQFNKITEGKKFTIDLPKK